MAGVDTKHSEYEALEERWQRCRDTSEGEDAVKYRGTKYLPQLDSHKKDQAQSGFSRRYSEYKMRALYYNAVGRTITGLSGAIFQKAPSVEVGSVMKDHIKDITLTDQPVDIFAMMATREYLTTGRFGILVDMSTELATTPRPYWVLYKAEDIINWKFRNLGGDKELSLVVLRETVEEQNPEDEFDIEPIVQYRVLRLSDDGLYTQQIYLPSDSTANPMGGKRSQEYIPQEVIVPTRRGVPLDFIPFSLPWSVGSPPLLDLVSVNLSHYRGSADLKHGLHFTALPTPWVSGQTDTGSPLSIGAGVAWSLDKDGKAGMLEFTGQGLAAIREDMTEMQKMMATLGARLLEESPRYSETATGVSMRHGSDYASLRMIAQIVEAQVSYALKIHEWWLSTETLVTKVAANIELNKVFFEASVTADELRALLMALQESGISFKTFYERLSNTGWTREGIDSDEELADIMADGDKFKKPTPNSQQPPDPKSTAPGAKPPPRPVTG